VPEPAKPRRATTHPTATHLGDARRRRDLDDRALATRTRFSKIVVDPPIRNVGWPAALGNPFVDTRRGRVPDDGRRPDWTKTLYAVPRAASPT